MPELTSSVLGPDGDRISVEVRGEVDLDTSDELRRTVRAALDRSVDGVDLDLTGVTFCDCAALNVLLALRLRALKQGKTVVIREAGDAVHRLLSLTHTEELFAVPTTEGPDTPADPQHEAPQLSEDSVRDLRIEVAQLRRAMRTRPVIDLARGILMASFGLSSDDAWSVLVEASQHTNTKLHVLADDLVTAVKGEPLPEAVREHLWAAVAKAGAHAGAEATRLR